MALDLPGDRRRRTPWRPPVADQGLPVTLADNSLTRALVGYCALADQATLVVTATGDGLRTEVRWANRAATVLLGRPAVDLLGGSLSSLAAPGQPRIGLDGLGAGLHLRRSAGQAITLRRGDGALLPLAVEDGCQVQGRAPGD